MRETHGNTQCVSCGNIRQYDNVYDAYLCAHCNIWLEPKCSDTECEYCHERPERPDNVEPESGL